MVLPVVAYGHPVLKHVAEDIEENSPEIQQLIADMFETVFLNIFGHVLQHRMTVSHNW